MTDKTSTRRIALVALTKEGLGLAVRVRQGLAGDVHIYAKQRALKACGSEAEASTLSSFDALKPLLKQLWGAYDQMVLFFALGAAIRLMAPLLQDKKSDPGVVVIDDAGTFAISAVSGHAGGANDLAKQCAEQLGAVPVITTASDVHRTLAVDLLGETLGWHREHSSQMTKVSAAIVNGEPVALLQEAGQRDWWNETAAWPKNLIQVSNLKAVSTATFSALLVISDRLLDELPTGLPTIVYRPPSLVLGVGCQRGVSFADLDAFITTTLQVHRLAFQCIAILASADIKEDEVALQMLAQRYSWRFETHPVEALKTVTAIATPSERVQRLIGTPSVSEAAALLSAHDGQLVLAKCTGKGMTLAVARRLFSTSVRDYSNSTDTRERENHGEPQQKGK